MANRNQREVARRARIVATIERDYPDETPAERAAMVEDWIADELFEEAADLAESRELCGYPQDTPCLQSCDMWGTGEGRFHGVIGA